MKRLIWIICWLLYTISTIAIAICEFKLKLRSRILAFFTDYTFINGNYSWRIMMTWWREHCEERCGRRIDIRAEKQTDRTVHVPAWSQLTGSYLFRAKEVTDHHLPSKFQRSRSVLVCFTCARNILSQHNINFFVDVERKVRFPCVWRCFICVVYRLGSYWVRVCLLWVYVVIDYMVNSK